MLEDWLEESIGMATQFVYYEFRAGAGKQIYPSVLSQLVRNPTLKSGGFWEVRLVPSGARRKPEPYQRQD